MFIQMTVDGDARKCQMCGADLPEWSDIAGALEESLKDAPIGMRPMLLQAIRELRKSETTTTTSTPNNGA